MDVFNEERVILKMATQTQLEEIKKDLYIIKNSRYGKEIKDAIFDSICHLANIKPESISTSKDD